MAIDEAILLAKLKNNVPNTLRLYRWNPSAISIGKFQNIEKEVDLMNCKKSNVDVVRRITGGGAVYHDIGGEITYSIIAKKRDLKVENISDVYSIIYDGMTEALKVLGLKGKFNDGSMKNCPNLTINGKKISGTAQANKKSVVLQHGTLLLEANLEKMFTYLTVKWGKTREEVVNIAKQRITSIKNEIERNISLEEVNRALIIGFEKALRIKLTNGKLTTYEVKLAEKLYNKKYLSEKWNHNGEYSNH
jgi:lipoate-protein ligase A